MFSDIMILLRLATSMIGLFMLVLVMFMIYLFQNLIRHLSNYSIIQKPYFRQYVDFTMAIFADALRPNKFTGVHFKRCQSQSPSLAYCAAYMGSEAWYSSR